MWGDQLNTFETTLVMVAIIAVVIGGFHWIERHWHAWRAANRARDLSGQRTAAAARAAREQVQRDLSARLARRLAERGDTAASQFTAGAQPAERLDRHAEYGTSTSLRLVTPTDRGAA